MQLKDSAIAARSTSFSKTSLPIIDFSHIDNLTDETGIIQHALFTMPNRKEGYCIDDNARALLLMLWAGKDRKNETAVRLLPVYLSYIHYMQSNDGYFRNFIASINQTIKALSYTKSIEEERGSEDSFGRTIMALGFLVNESPTPLLVRIGSEIFAKAYPHIKTLSSLRGMANSIIGLCQFIKFNYPDDLKVNLVKELANRLVNAYKDHKEDDWCWFEPVLTYDNAILPLALLNAYEVTQEEVFRSIAMESMLFLESKVFNDGIVRPVGNKGWCIKNSMPARFDQQCIDVMAMVLYYQQAFRITREQYYLERMYVTYQWFLGRNDLGASLYDPSTGGCADGLLMEGINLNQGAESTLAYWISHMVVASSLEE